MDEDSRAGEQAPYLDDDIPPDLLAVARRYAAQPVYRPTAADTQHLLVRLLEEPAPVTLPRPRIWWPFHVLVGVRWRLRLLGAAFWLATALFLFAGATLTPATVRGGAAPLVILVPLSAVLGLARAVRMAPPGVREIETSCPATSVKVTAGLALAIAACEGVLALLLTAALALLRQEPFLDLLTAWLGPLLLLTATSLPVALRWGASVSAAVGGVPWLMLATYAVVSDNSLALAVFSVSPAPGMLALRLTGTALGAAVLIAALVRGERWRPPVARLNN